MTRITCGVLISLVGLCAAPEALAHSGPPFPVVTDQRSGPYVVSVWTDPDTTDDGSAGGRFWVVVSGDPPRLPAGTHVSISATPGGSGRPGASVDVHDVNADGRTFPGAVVLDHEGPYRIDIRITGPGGSADVAAQVDATYDLRPSRLTAALYVVPFALIGLLWIRMLLKRPHRPAHTGARMSS
jgi:hypothetical protein